MLVLYDSDLISFHLIHNYFVLNLILPLKLIQNSVMIFIRYANWVPLNVSLCLFLLHKLWVIYATYLIAATSRRGCTIVWVAVMTLSLFPCYYQYQFLFAFIVIKYTVLAIISPALNNCFLAVLFPCNFYGYGINLKT